MADPEHVKILKEGSEAWNKWVATNVSVAANLSNADFSNAKLSLTDFQEVDFRNANLEGADLSFCKFIWTDLSNANLRRADLRSASFGEANLTNADLRGADLSFTVFNGTELSRANLQGAVCQQTYFTEVDLSKTLGLGECDHWSPSNLDLGTLARSKDLPESFLVGCGISHFLIKHLAELREDPRQFQSCFISHSSQDLDFARKLHSDLVQRGIRCWFAPENMRAGRKILRQIDQAVGEYDKLLLVLSTESMKSRWVEYEILRAREREIRDNQRLLFPISIVPYRIIKEWQLFSSDEERDLASEIREYFIPNFSSWRADADAYRRSLERLLSDLKL
jgi:hypothetical protein